MYTIHASPASARPRAALSRGCDGSAVAAQGKKGGAGAKKEGAKAPKEKKDKQKAAAPPKDLTGKGREKTAQQLKAEEGAWCAVLRAVFLIPSIARMPLHSPRSLLLISCTRLDRRKDP